MPIAKRAVRPPRWIPLALVVLLASACAGDRPPLPSEESIVIPAEGTVIVYVEAARRTAGPILSTFSQQTGIEVQPVYRDALGDGFLPALRREAEAGRVDLFWGESPLPAMELAAEGLAVPFRPVAARPVPWQYRDNQFRWIGFAANPRVILYNTDLVERKDAPQSIWDMARAPWGGRGALPSIDRGPAAYHAAALFTIWGEERARAFYDETRANGTRIVEDDAAVRRLISSGQTLWGVLGMDESICANREGEPVHIFFPDRFNLGAVVVPHVAALMRGAPHPAQAKGLFGYLLSKEAGWQMGQYDCALITLVPEVPRPNWVPTLSVFNVTQVDNAALFEAYRSHADYFRAWSDPDRAPGTLGSMVR